MEPDINKKVKNEKISNERLKSYGIWLILVIFKIKIKIFKKINKFPYI